MTGNAMGKVLVVGACGYLGARLSRFLAEKGHRVTVFDYVNPLKYRRWVSLMEEVIVGDIRDEASISGLAEKKYDAIIHLISLDHRKSEDDPNRVASVNVMPIWNLLHRFTGKGLKKFIYFSTIHVYGELPDALITEVQSPAPRNAYGLTHLMSENVCNYFNDKTQTDCINVRISNGYGSPVFGENNCWWLVINDLCRTAFKENRIQLLSDGSPRRDFIHISDICRAIEALMLAEVDGFEGNVFHIASGKTLTILELAHAVKDVFKRRFGKEIPVLLPDRSVSYSAGGYNNIAKYRFDTSRIKSLGFQVETDLNQGISQVLEYLDQNPVSAST